MASIIGRRTLAAPPLRRERLIAGCRVAFALCSLLALWMEPSQPKRFEALAYALVAGYSLYSALLVVWLWRRRSLPRRLPLVLHSVDLLLFAVIILVTDGPSSPFGVALIFLLAAGAVRWQQQGAAWTGAIAILLHAGVALLSLTGTLESGFELNQAIIRFVQLVVVAALLAYISAHDSRLRAVTAAMSEWPAPIELKSLIPELLQHAAGVMHASCAVLVWEEDEEPWLNLGLWTTNGFDWQKPTLDELPELAPAELTGRVFGVAESVSKGGFRLLRERKESNFSSDPIPAAVRALLGDGPVLSAPIHGQSVEGRLYLSGLPDLTSDELLLADVLSQQLALRLDQRALFEQFHQRGVAEERINLARDLHDGVIQSLASGAIRLETARQLLQQDVGAAQQLIEDVQDLLVTEQGELRQFLGSLEPKHTRLPAVVPAFGERMNLLTARIGRHWNLNVQLDNEVPDAQLNEGMDRHAHCIVLEALVNASRHGKASRAEVRLRCTKQHFRILVRDNGHGFAFVGVHNLSQLQTMNQGPVSLMRRVALLGGQLEIDSAPNGATLSIHLPNH